MGKDNVCVHGLYEGLYFIHNDDYVVYRSDLYGEDEVRLLRDVSQKDIVDETWVRDDEGTMCEEEDVFECFTRNFMEMFPDFESAAGDTYLDRNCCVILENDFFYIGVEDNEWSLAIKLLQKEAKSEDDSEMKERQKNLYKEYLEGMKIALLKRLPRIGTYTGSSTSGVIKREDVLERNCL